MTTAAKDVTVVLFPPGSYQLYPPTYQDTWSDPNAYNSGTMLFHIQFGSM